MTCNIKKPEITTNDIHTCDTLIYGILTVAAQLLQTARTEYGPEAQRT